jgi:hypothetical protein
VNEEQPTYQRCGRVSTGQGSNTPTQMLWRQLAMVCGIQSAVLTPPCVLSSHWPVPSIRFL